MQISLILSPGTWQNTNRMWKQKKQPKDRKRCFFSSTNLVLIVQFCAFCGKKWKHNQSIFIFRNKFFLPQPFLHLKSIISCYLCSRDCQRREKNAKELLNGVECKGERWKECLEWLVGSFWTCGFIITIV